MKYFYILFVLVLGFKIQAQFVPTVTWTYAIGSACYGSAAAADMDNDGKKEIVFATYANDGMVYCLNSENGTLKWSYNIGGCGDVALNIYDLDMDGQLDVFVNGSCNPTAFCINGNTGLLTWSVSSGGGDSPATIADMDGDGRPEIVFGNFAGQLRILNGENGTLAKSIQVYSNALQTDPVLVDVNDDGRLDIIVANYFNAQNTYSIQCYDYTSELPIWTNTLSAVSNYHAYHGGALADIDKDGMLEYVIGANNGMIRALNVENGTVLWTKTNPGSSCFNAISIADVNNDDTLDVIYHRGTANNGLEVLNGYNGNVEWNYSINSGSFRGSAISDLNGNGKLDLVSTHYVGEINAIEPFTGLLWSLNVLSYFPTFPGTIPYVDASNAPLIADFDGDGALDVFFAMGYGTYTVNPNSTGKAFLIKGGVGTCPNWLMFRHDNNRTGYMSSAEVISQCFVSSNNEESELTKIKISVSPQPFTNKTEISVSGLNTKQITLTITDIAGKIVELQGVGDAKFRENKIYWDLNSENLTLGIYFYHIEGANQSWNGKLLKYK